MNAARIAVLLRELADAIEAPDDEQTAPVERKSAIRKSRRITDIEKARARRSLRRLGIES